jgi:hypothetical protein
MKLSFKFKILAALPMHKALWSSLIRKLGGLQSWSAYCRHISCTDWGEAQLSGQNWSLVTMPTELSKLPNNDLLLIEISTKYATYKMVHLLIKIMSTDSSPTGEYSFDFNNFRIRRT